MSIPEEVAKSRSAFRFVSGHGYTYIGPPPVPAVRIAPAATCEPGPAAVDGSAHFLRGPGGGAPMRMVWHPAQKEWEPSLASGGRRVAFGSTYLAAHGWAYVGPA